MKQINQLLSSVGDGTGTTNAIGDYSVTPLSITYKNATFQETSIINRIILKLEDAGLLSTVLYGTDVVLTNGIRIYVRDSVDAIIDEITAYPIINNGDWAGHGHDLKMHSLGAGNPVMTIMLDFGSDPITLNSQNGEYLEVYLNDSFVALVKHSFVVKGYILNKTY